MRDIIAALNEQQQELSNLIDPLDNDGWARPSRCEGWSVSDVVLHMAQTNEMAIASVEDRIPAYLAEMSRGLPASSTIDDGADAMVVKERAMPPDAIRKRWHDTVAHFNELLMGADPHRRVTWVAGQLSMQTLVTTRLSETWIHTDDIAHAFGIAPEPTNRLRYIARLAWRTLPYAFSRAGRELHGPVALDLSGPDGSPWSFNPDGDPLTTIIGPGVEFCLVAARRLAPRDTSLRGVGPDADAVLDLVRTYA